MIVHTKSIGFGYNLKLSTLSEAESYKILAEVKSVVSNAFIQKETHANKCSELQIILPSDTIDELKPLFPKLFNGLSAKKEELGIINIGIGLTSMDDVFVR